MNEIIKALPLPIRRVAERIEDACRCEIELRREVSRWAFNYGCEAASLAVR